MRATAMLIIGVLIGLAGSSALAKSGSGARPTPRNTLDVRMVDAQGARVVRGGGREIGPARYRISLGIDRPIIEGSYVLRLRFAQPGKQTSTLTYDVTAKLRR